MLANGKKALVVNYSRVPDYPTRNQGVILALLLYFAYEVESVMECGEHGGLQRWQLTIIHLSASERKLHFIDN